jgi:outer membrane protein OmpA-like peptidoglycan-associated protein
LNSGSYEKLELEPNSLVSLNLSHSDSLINKDFKVPNSNGKDTTLVVMVWEKKEVIQEVNNNNLTESLATELNKKYAFSSVYFDFNKFVIGKNFEKDLVNLASMLKDNPDKLVIVKTLSDERGDIFYNLELTTKRAKQIYAFLVKKGIDPKQIKLQSLGEAVYEEKCSPKCDESIHSKYRRADFEIR